MGLVLSQSGSNVARGCLSGTSPSPFKAVFRLSAQGASWVIAEGQFTFL